MAKGKQNECKYQIFRNQINVEKARKYFVTIYKQSFPNDQLPFSYEFNFNQFIWLYNDVFDDYIKLCQKYNDLQDRILSPKFIQNQLIQVYVPLHQSQIFSTPYLNDRQIVYMIFNGIFNQECDYKIIGLQNSTSLEWWRIINDFLAHYQTQKNHHQKIQKYSHSSSYILYTMAQLQLEMANNLFAWIKNKQLQDNNIQVMKKQAKNNLNASISFIDDQNEAKKEKKTINQIISQNMYWMNIKYADSLIDIENIKIDISKLKQKLVQIVMIEKEYEDQIAELHINILDRNFQISIIRSEIQINCLQKIRTFILSVNLIHSITKNLDKQSLFRKFLIELADKFDKNIGIVLQNIGEVWIFKWIQILMISVDHDLNLNELFKQNECDQKDQYLIKCLIRYTYLFDWDQKLALNFFKQTGFSFFQNQQKLNKIIEYIQKIVKNPDLYKKSKGSTVKLEISDNIQNLPIENILPVFKPSPQFLHKQNDKLSWNFETVVRGFFGQEQFTQAILLRNNLNMDLNLEDVLKEGLIAIGTPETELFETKQYLQQALSQNQNPFQTQKQVNFYMMQLPEEVKQNSEEYEKLRKCLTKQMVYMFAGHGNAFKVLNPYLRLDNQSILRHKEQNIMCQIFLFGCQSISSSLNLKDNYHNQCLNSLLVKYIQNITGQHVKQKVVVGCLWNSVSSYLNPLQKEILQDIKCNGDQYISETVQKSKNFMYQQELEKRKSFINSFSRSLVMYQV